MRIRTWCTLASLAGAVLAVVGCSQYNSAIGLPGTSAKVSDQYRQFLAEYQARLDEGPANTSRPQTRHAQFDAPASNPPRSEIQTADYTTHPSPAEAPRWASSQTDPSVAELGLYGTLPQSLPQRRASLDGPDNLRQITFTNAGIDMDPRVDPTGQWIIFASTRHRPNPDIYLQRIDGTAVQQVTHDPASDRMPVFSPDGRHVAFASNRSGNWDIYLTDLDGSQPVQLTNDPTDEIHPSFSPDGSKIVYCSYGRQSGQWEMVVIDVENPAKRRFIGFGLFPEWSPGGDKILFQRARQRGTRWFSVWTIDYQDGEGVRPTEIAASANAGAITPRWSPDGRHIVFSTVMNPDQTDGGAPPQADVWIMAADGSDRVNMTRNQFANTQPIWSPDGSIYFVSNRGVAETQNIWALKPDAAMRIAADAGRGKPAIREAAAEKPESVGAAVMAGEDAP
jgi:TolB protein